MLTQRADAGGGHFTRRDARRLVVGATILIVALTAILGVEGMLDQGLNLQVGQAAPRDIIAPRETDFVSEARTAEAREAAREAVPDQYDYTIAKASAIAAAQQVAFEERVDAIDAAFSADVTAEEREALLADALPQLEVPAGVGETLMSLERGRWAAVRTEAARVLDVTLRFEVKDSEVEPRRLELADEMAGDLSDDERRLAAAIIAPLLVGNSSFSAELTAIEEDRAAAAVAEVRVRVARDQIIVRQGDPIGEAELEMLEALGLNDDQGDLATFAGWALMAVLLVGFLLAWIWRFRPGIWHRNSILILIGLLLIGATLALQLSAGRSILTYFMPTAAIAMLLAVLLDATVATFVIALVAIVAGAINGLSLEIATYVFLGGVAGIVTVRRGDRLQVFIQAGIAVAAVNALVVSVFSLLGERDLRGVLELWLASGVAGAGSAVAAVGSFAVLGSVFGILTVFQLLELANPSQPLLRRLLVETPGTYHHSLMVGNLAERAAEAIGADPLVTRVAAYYHDIGKLANPLAFIENQAGAENVHDQLDPETSAQILKHHVADGINIAYKARLPKALIAYIPQHHGTAIMSYFYARAKGLAAEPYGGPTTAEGAKAAAAVEEGRFRHAGPKPQSREAALIMLADGVEASVRSLAARDEPAIRAMVSRIIDERVGDGQFDECELTLRDLEKIREAFIGQLLGMYHTRIEYPQNKVVELESRRAAAGGGDGAAS